MSNEATIAGFVAAVESGDMEAAAQLVHDDIEMYWPQSGERFRGKDNALEAMRASEVKPEPAGEPRIVGGGDVFVMTMPLRYGDEVWHYVGVFEIADGLIRRTTEYFGAPFPASEARAPYAEAS
jgi:hypothetical protein